MSFGPSLACDATATIDQVKLKIGLPKGSLQEATFSLFERAGFKFGDRGTHTSRTMMLREIGSCPCRRAPPAPRISQRLLEAHDRADAAGVELAAKALEARIRLEAKTIAASYLAPPHTTDFAILFLPIESLYAEVLRRPGLMDSLQRDFRVTLAGPTTLLAMLNSLHMGFRTLALEKRSSEVWKVLGAVKTEFGKFGEVLAKTKKKLDEASNSIEMAERRTRVMTRELRVVEALPSEESQRLLPDAGGDVFEPDGL